MTDLSMAFGGSWDDRAAHSRADTTPLRNHPDTLVLPVWRGKPQLAADQLGWVAPDAQVLRHAKDKWVFLGHHDGRPRFAADVSSWEPDALDRAALAMFLDPTEQHYPGAAPGTRFAELRLAMASLAPSDAAMASTARALFNWHRTHRYCAACGAQSDLQAAGWERQCPSCGAKHFPRTDPVVIMLVTHDNDVLLGRSPGWPDGMYSALAGFVEPGETLEAAVAREVAEETGIHVDQVRYIASQPWPFPNSLMMGCVARARTRQITLDPELQDARWYSRETILRAWSGEDPSLKAARPGAIAHGLIGAWLAGRI